MSLGYQNRISDRRSCSIAANSLLSGRLLAFRNSLENVFKALKVDVGTSWGIKSFILESDNSPVRILCDLLLLFICGTVLLR